MQIEIDTYTCDICKKQMYMSDLEALDIVIVITMACTCLYSYPIMCHIYGDKIKDFGGIDDLL